MAFKKKTAKDQFCSDMTINKLANEAAQATTIAKFYEEKYKGLKKSLDKYLRYDENAPEIIIGKEGTLRIEDVGTITFTQPRRLQNADAKALLLAKVHAGELTVDDLVACVSTLTVDAVENLLSDEELATVKKPDENSEGPIVTITLRASSAFKNNMNTRLENPILAAEEALEQDEADKPTKKVA